MKTLFFLILSFFLFPVFYISAQEAQVQEVPAAAENNDAEPEPQDLELTHIDMDIRTSSLMELAAWARELGLPEGGSRDELATRLRAHYGITAVRPAAPAGQRIINIESARTTEYFTLESVNEEYIRLTGDVVISLREGNALHRIRAWEVLLNRTRNVLTATGNVEYVREEGNTIERFRGDTITVNLDNWASIFMDGAAERTAVGAATTYRFAGRIISRNDEDVTVLSNAVITNPDNEEALWSVHASRLWLLPGNDFAVLNAVLRVGNIPVFYFPFFYLPADQIVFQPALGTRYRDGTFLQTTTYILGRPQATAFAESSITRIFGGDDGGDKVREGIFLRSTGERVFTPANIRLAMLFDVYSNMGAYLGTEIAMPARRSFGATSISAGLGLTRNLYQVGGTYTPFRRDGETSEWNSSPFFFMNVPFRYRFVKTGSYTIEHATMEWEIPFFSDPFVERDFMRRSAGQDLFGMIRDFGAGAAAWDNTMLSSYEWRLRGSFAPPVTHLNPFINSFSVSSFNSTLIFNNRLSPGYDGPTHHPNPGRAFFFPSSFTLFSASAAMSGAPFRFGAAPPRQVITGPAPGIALLPDLPISPWAIEEELLREREIVDAFTLSPPVLNQRFSTPTVGGASFSFTYGLTPSAASELHFDSGRWREQEDVNWGDVSSIQSRLQTGGNIGFRVDQGAGAAANFASLGLSGRGFWHGYLFLNEGATEYATPQAIRDARERAARGTGAESNWDFSSRIAPFSQNPTWRATNFQYRLSGLLGRTVVDTTGTVPQWNWNFGGWDSTDINMHQIVTSFAATVRDNAQNLSVTTSLPPRAPVITPNAVFRAGIFDTAIRSRILLPWEETGIEDLVIDPLTLDGNLRFTPTRGFRQQITFDPELSAATIFSSALSFDGFNASFSAGHIHPWRYNFNGSVDINLPSGWVQLDELGFHPQGLAFSYVRAFTQNNIWNRRLSFTLTMSSSLSFDLQQYTNSSLAFDMGLNLRITNFLDLNFSTRSDNAVVFMYFQNLPFFNLPTQLYPGMQHNFFLDLLNSFRFDNPELRRRSGFKLSRMNLSLIHHLGDWNARLSMNMTPHADLATRVVRFRNDITFLVQWLPISEIRTQVDFINDDLRIW